jgi:hypothetical protein
VEVWDQVQWLYDMDDEVVVYNVGDEAGTLVLINQERKE